MADCWRCGTRITSLGDGWVHLVDGHDDHAPAPQRRRRRDENESEQVA